MMSNHFHVLIRVPESAVPDDSQLLSRLDSLYGPKSAPSTLARQAIIERGRVDAEVRQALLERMGDISAFMKELKQRFSRWYNRRHERFGTLWAERFKSVLVEDRPSSLEAVAAYIDLNPVRAGLVEDPKDYRYCGYASALAGNRLARQGLMSFQGILKATTEGQKEGITGSKTEAQTQKRPAVMMEKKSAGTTEKETEAVSSSWPEFAAAYRMRMFSRAGTVRQSGKVVLVKEKIKEVLAQGGELSLAEVLRLRLRHMTDGVALGSQGFVNEVFALHREKFGSRRKDGARPIRILSSLGINALRDLKLRTVG